MMYRKDKTPEAVYLLAIRTPPGLLKVVQIENV